MEEKKIIEVWLSVPVLCEVEVGLPDIWGEAPIYKIRLADRGNFETPTMIDAGSLTDSEYQEIDELAAKAFEKK